MNDKPAMANTQAFAVITQDELSSLRAELAELRAQVPVYQIRLASGAAATAWVDCTEVDYH
ncbi:MAG: hypothetical protein QG592_466, partial [Pseudomonadota bacterium]|nr:hypothetical protein [Pseudomonadota bacterium]